MIAVGLFFKYYMIYFFKVDSKSKASHLSNVSLPVALLWITRSRKSVELAKKGI